MNDFKRGSEWRRWDLHVHTPESHLNNNFGNDFDNYVKELFNKAIEKEIYAIGITDYFTIDGYKKIKEYVENEEKLRYLFEDDEEKIEKIKNILLLPNIEFRLNKLVGSRRINFHVIFSDKVSVSNIEENFLHEINFVYQGEPQNNDEKWKLKLGNIKKLGKKLKREHLGFTGSDIEVGMQNSVVDDSEIVNILKNKRSIFSNKYLIVVPSDEDLSKISWDGQDHQTRKVIIQKADCLFSSNPNTRDFGLGKKHDNPEEFIKKFKSLKPCIHGSDAHSFDKLFEPDKQRYLFSP